MSTFAPVYRPPQLPRHKIWSKQQHRRDGKKRKRDDDGSAEEELDPALPPPDSFIHPVNKTDPFHIAGHAREYALPPPPFPHAPVQSAKPPTKSIDKELAGLNPPLYYPSAIAPQEQATSSRRRHLDNLTTILHTCMLKEDWPRARRAWSLLIRTEIGGRGIDVRRNGRWGIGAELLMRRKADEPRKLQASLETLEDADAPLHNEPAKLFSDEGFELAREYYERLVIQYPYTRGSMHTLNATAIYPALFTVWIYQVQDESKRARSEISDFADPGAEHDASANDEGADVDQRARLRRIRAKELDQARAIENRIHELCLSPPYDSHAELRCLRDMLGKWIGDLQKKVVTLDSPFD
ncbi:hypothetical protein BDY17DRAFT_97729 [Neohortaea acidophila]|uniref:Uncharacterized protein n=1 Tax=Neohortaea acidophila TaxID=245834 RepID=A0A6A6PZI8_9PEZI|nr:uncharacterized protein BDY17DRAFT_97729 [Neohortaea acidophila]KAF2485149.1 hypothetical protein BDY17DRAFT_97729 [Neohortaea acidophila]